MKRAMLFLSVFAILTAGTVSGCGGKADPDQGGDPKGKGGTKTVQARLSLDTGLDEGLTAMAVSSDGKFLIAQTNGKLKNVQIWDLEKKEKLHAFDSESGSVLPVAIAPDNKTAVYARQSPPSIPVIDIATGKELRRLGAKQGGLSYFMKGLSFSRKGDLLVIASNQDLIGWDPNSGEQKFAWRDDKEIQALSNLFDDDKKVAAGYDKDLIKIWDLTTGKPIQTLQGKGDFRVFYLAVSPDGKTLAARYSIGPVKVWDLTTGKESRSLEPRPSLFGGIHFLPDNKTVAYTGNDQKVHLVRVDTGASSHILEGHTQPIGALGVTPDGATLVSGSNDKTIKVWDVKAAP